MVKLKLHLFLRTNWIKLAELLIIDQLPLHASFQKCIFNPLNAAFNYGLRKIFNIARRSSIRLIINGLQCFTYL